jgi:hypothetical protein
MQRCLAVAVLMSVLSPAIAQSHEPPDSMPGASQVAYPRPYLHFNGTSAYAEIPSRPALSLSDSGLTVAAWLRPDTLAFPKHEGSVRDQQYVHWLGKGVPGQQEWSFRIYSLTPAGPRQTRISFYIFSPGGDRGCGSYAQDPIQPGQWIHVVGTVDPATKQVTLYKNGRFRHSASYASLTPAPGTAPLRLGTRDFGSFFDGAVGPVLVWRRPLSARQVGALYAANTVPSDGLVAEYRLTEGSGATIRDTVAPNSGALHGAIWQSTLSPPDTSAGASGGGC